VNLLPLSKSDNGVNQSGDKAQTAKDGDVKSSLSDDPVLLRLLNLKRFVFGSRFWVSLLLVALAELFILASRSLSIVAEGWALVCCFLLVLLFFLGMAFTS
jgi:hypothetical protein